MSPPICIHQICHFDSFPYDFRGKFMTFSRNCQTKHAKRLSFSSALIFKVGGGIKKKALPLFHKSHGAFHRKPHRFPPLHASPKRKKGKRRKRITAGQKYFSEGVSFKSSPFSISMLTTGTNIPSKTIKSLAIIEINVFSFPETAAWNIENKK